MSAGERADDGGRARRQPPSVTAEPVDTFTVPGGSYHGAEPAVAINAPMAAVGSNIRAVYEMTGIADVLRSLDQSRNILNHTSSGVSDADRGVMPLVRHGGNS